MDTSRPTRQKAGEWIRRYLPCEIAGTVGELGGAAVAYALTGSLAAAALAATVGAFVGYYAAAYANAVRWSFQSQRHRRLASRIMVANLLALRSVAIEFGPGEVIDSVLIRPLAFYAVPMLVGNLLLGWIIAKIASDLVFYMCAIFSYERFNRSLARWRPPDEEVDDAIVATAAAS